METGVAKRGKRSQGTYGTTIFLILPGPKQNAWLLGCLVAGLLIWLVAGFLGYWVAGLLGCLLVGLLGYWVAALLG